MSENVIQLHHKWWRAKGKLYVFLHYFTKYELHSSLNTACCICKYTMYAHTIIALREWVSDSHAACRDNQFYPDLLLVKCAMMAKKQFSDAFSKLLKATVSFMSVCLSAWNNSAPTGRIFMKFDITNFLEKPVEKIQVSLKSDKNNGYFMNTNVHFWSHLARFVLGWKMF